MSDDQIDRKIAVIFATDVVGYSKSMEADEAQTIKNLRACRKLLDKSLKKSMTGAFSTRPVVPSLPSLPVRLRRWNARPNFRQG